MKKIDKFTLTNKDMVGRFREITQCNLDIKLTYVLFSLGINKLTPIKQIQKILTDLPEVSQAFGTVTTINKIGEVRIYSWIAMEEPALIMFSIKYKSQIVIVHSAEQMILQIFCHTGQGPGNDPIVTYTEKLVHEFNRE